MLIFVYLKFHRKEIIPKMVSFNQISDYDSFVKHPNQPTKKIISLQHVRTRLTYLHF